MNYYSLMQIQLFVTLLIKIHFIVAGKLLKTFGKLTIRSESSFRAVWQQLKDGSFWEILGYVSW